MKIRYFAAIVGGFILASGPVLAQTVTFSYVSKPGAEVGTAMPDGGRVAGSYWTGTSTSTWADGKKSTDSYTCVSTTQPPHDSIFMAHTVCDMSNEQGTYTGVYGCNFTNAAGTDLGCVGGLYGKTGQFKGRRGGITFSGTNMTGSGVAQWRN